MKYKLLSTVLLTLLLAIAVVSASVTSTISTPAVFTKTNSQTSFSVTNSATVPVNIQITLPSTITDANNHVLSISSQSQLVYNNIGPGQNTGLVTVIYSGDTSSFNVGKVSSNIVVQTTSASNSSDTIIQTTPLSFVNDFCKYGQNGSSLALSNIDIKNNDGDDLEWNPLDHIKIKIEVENNGDDTISGVYTDLGLIDSKGRNIIGNLENLTDKKISVGSLSSGKSKSVEYVFQVPSDFKEESYSLVIKTYKSGKEASICSSFSSDLDSGYFQEITGTRQTDEKKQVVVSNIQV